MTETKALPTEDERNAIREGVRAVVSRFGDDYWLERDEDGRFPHEFHRAMAEAGGVGLTLPEEYGGPRPRGPQSAVVMHRVGMPRRRPGGRAARPHQTL